MINLPIDKLQSFAYLSKAFFMANFVNSTVRLIINFKEQFTIMILRPQLILILLLPVIISCTGGNNKSTSENVAVNQETQTVIKEKTDLSDHPGQPVYNQHCLPCHQADGSGVPGMYPPIVDTKWVNGDKSELISIVVHGLDEEIEVDGEIYNTVMAPLPHLSDQEVSDVLNFVRLKFGTSPLEKIAPEDVATVRKTGPST